MRVFILALVAAGEWQSADLRAQVDPKSVLLERDGFRLLEAGDARRAADTFREALKADPKNATLHLGAGGAAWTRRP